MCCKPQGKPTVGSSSQGAEHLYTLYICTQYSLHAVWATTSLVSSLSLSLYIQRLLFLQYNIPYCGRVAASVVAREMVAKVTWV